MQTMVGITLGFAGVLVLVGSRGSFQGASSSWLAIAVLVLASAGWASGSLYAKYTPEPASPLMTAAQQMLAGGAILLVASVALGEIGAFQWSNVSRQSIVAFVYLTLIGSLVGFSNYAWLLKNTTPARLSTYAYVNPVVAVFLGWAIGGETMTPRMLWAALVIVAGVVIITTRRAAVEGSRENARGANSAEVSSP
jgi:drug/metabolite transporter (DMT)-like permease